jgi:hypothetical protein
MVQQFCQSGKDLLSRSVGSDKIYPGRRTTTAGATVTNQKNRKLPDGL